MDTRQKGTIKSNGNAGKKEKTEKTKFEEILQKLERTHKKEIESLTVKIEILKTELEELEENKKKTECIKNNMIKFTESFEALKLLVLANASSICSNRNQISKNKNGVQTIASILQKIQSECLE